MFTRLLRPLAMTLSTLFWSISVAMDLIELRDKALLRRDERLVDVVAGAPLMLSLPIVRDETSVYCKLS